MKNKIKDLNDHLFAQLECLSDDEMSDEKLEFEPSAPRPWQALPTTL